MRFDEPQLLVEIARYFDEEVRGVGVVQLGGELDRTARLVSERCASRGPRIAVIARAGSAFEQTQRVNRDAGRRERLAGVVFA